MPSRSRTSLRAIDVRRLPICPVGASAISQSAESEDDSSSITCFAELDWKRGKESLLWSLDAIPSFGMRTSVGLDRRGG